MAGAFNLTAQLNLKGPSNIGNIVASIKNQLGNINSTVKFTLDPNASKNVAQLNTNLQGLNQTFKDTQTNATAAANAIKLFGASVSQVGSNKLQTTLTSANQASQQLAQTQSALGDSIRSSSSEMQEFGKQAGLAVRRFTAFSTVTSVIYGLVNAASKGVGAFIEFDKELVKLQQVTGESQQGLKGLENTITGLSTGLGVSSSELINVASTLAQAGLNASDTEKALKALALSSLAPSFDNMNETVEGSIALMRQFGIGAGELDKALGSVNAVAAKFAVEASDIISAVQRTGGVFAAASRGVSEGTDALNEFVAVFTSVRATTRESAETIATGLRTIFTRIQRESTIEALKEYGVNLTDVSGKFVGAYKSVELLSKGLSNLDPRDLKFSRIIEELGGFRQIGKVIPLIQEFSTAQQALSVAQQGQGSLTADSVKAQMSLANQISKTREEFLKLFREIGSSDAFQTLIRGALSVSSALIKVVESGRGLLPMLGVIAAIQGSKALTRFASGFGEGLTRGGNNKDDNASPSPATPRVRNFAVGGIVPGVGDTDSVPAMLTPGEFVVRKAAVRNIGADKLHSMNRYANGGKAAQIASVNKIVNVVDGDTFDAEVTPKSNPFTARFRLDNVDTYEKGNKKSRITREKLEDIKGFMPKYVYKSYASESTDPIVINPSTNVGPKTTAQTMADNATNYLASNIKTDNFRPVVDPKAGFGRYLAKLQGLEIPKEYTTGRYSDDDNGYNLGGRVQRLAAGGVAQRKVGYIDYDVIANSDNEAVVKKGMEATGMTGPRLYTDHLTQLAVQARKENSLDKLRAIYGVAGSGKTTLARGQGTDSGTLRQTERFPVLSPEDIQRATEVLILSSSVSKDKLDDFFGETDRTYTLSSTTKEEREGVRSRRAGRDISGIGLENRQPGSTTNAAADTAVGEALLSDRLGNRSTVLGRSESGRLRRKQGDELVDIVKKKIGFAWGGFAPMTAGHESIMDAAGAMGIPPEDFIYLVGANEGIKSGDPSSYRTAVFNQDARVLLAKAGAGSRGATILPKPRDFEVPSAFDITGDDARRRVLVPDKGSRTFVADKNEEQTQKYKDAGYGVTYLDRTGGISGTMVRDLIMSGDMGKLQEVLSPGVYELISNNIGRIQNRAGVLPEIIEQVKQNQGLKLSDIEQQIKAVGISRIDTKKVASDPEYAAKVQVLEELRGRRDKIKSAAAFEPYRLLDEMAKKNPEKYGLDFGGSVTPDIQPIRTMSNINERTGSLSPILRSIYDSMDKKPEWLTEFGIPDNITTQIKAKEVAKTLKGKRFPNDESLGDFSGEQIDIENVKQVWRAYGNSSQMKPEKLASYIAAKDYLKSQISQDVQKQSELTVDSIQKSKKVAVVGLRPADKKEVRGPMDLGGENVTMFISGLSSEYSEAVEGWRARQVENDVRFATDIQHKKMFGASDRYAFDFDETLVKGADILDANGKPDIPRYGDINAVRESMKGAELTQLGQKVKQLMREDPSFIKKSRILTARPQMTAGILADTLQRLELPFQESDITGVSTPVGDSGLNIIDEKTKRINNSIIAKAKAQDVRELESLIDDNLQNVLETRKTGKKAFHYTEISENLSEDQLQAYGIANIEGASLEMVLARLGARGGSVQNRAVDFDGGLGPAAQYFPGIGYDWPAEVKRTLDSDAISDAKEHFSRFYAEKNGEPQTVQAMAVGGKASRKVDFESGVGASPFGSIVSKKLDSSIYDLEKSSGLSSFEFDEAKRFADSAGYNTEEFKEYLAKRLANKKQNANLRMDPASLLRAITPEKNTSTPKQLALAETLKGEPDAGYRPILTEAQRIAANRSSVRNSALEDINNATRFAVGGVAEPEQKKEKQYGKIGLTEDGTMINAGYFKNDTRSGYATAYKMRDYLYYVGLSSATSGYGPKLYDVLMEAATEKGAMLTSDRSMVSGDAKNVWEYYFNNRPDVQKTPLKPSDWTRNNALIDPKLYGKEETWPPANDPAWILQSGYSKSPSLINSKDVIRSSAKVDSRALMSSFFSAKRGSSEPVVASNSNGEEFTVGYAKMAKGGKIDEGLDKYKQILSSILPPEFLSDEGLLRDKTGKSEEIEILAPKKKSFFGSLFSGRSRDDAPPASYDGALAYKALRHNLEKSKDQLDPKEYEKLKKYVDGSLAFHGGHDVVDVRKSSHRGALAHESFHDIQGFLYDNYPEIVDKIFSSMDKNKPQVEDWYHNFADKSYTGPGQYRLSHFFPDPDKEAPHVNKAFLSESMEALIRNKKTKTSETTSIAAVKTVDTSSLDLGRNELLPVLLSAASEGDSKAAEILSNIFGSAGLNKDFYKTLPRFATGGVVPGVGNSDTVPAMLNAGDFVIKKSSVNSVGTDKLASMAGYANGGSVSDQVPALLTPGEFVFSRSSAEKIGYNKLHSINNLGKFANGGMVGGRLALASGGEANPFLEMIGKVFDYINEVDSRKLPVKPGQNTSTSVSLDGSTIDMVKELASAVENLGIKSSDTAVLIRRGGDISYKAAQEAYEADLQKLKLSSASTEQIIKAENTLTQIREKSIRVTENRSLIESSLFNSKTGKSDGFGAVQQNVLLDADKFEAGIQRKKEKDFAKSLNTAPGGMLGASPAELSQAARTLASSPEEKTDTKNTAMLVAMQKNTGIKKSEFTNVGLSGSDIREYMAQSSLDRKTLAEMDKQLVRSKVDELKNSQGFGGLLLSEQKRRLDEVRELTQKEVATRREILNEIAKSQGLPSLSQKDPGTAFADFLSSRKGLFLSGILATAPRTINTFAPPPTSGDSAATRAGTVGGMETFAAGLPVAGKFGSFAPLALLGVAAAGLATAFKEARNAFIDFQKNLSGKELQNSINNLQQSFSDLAKDVTDVRIRENISRDLSSGLSKANNITDIENNNPRVDSYYRNLIDVLTSKNQATAVDRSKILDRFGTSAYVSSSLNDDSRRLYNERLIPERAQDNAKQYTDLAQFAQQSLEAMVKNGQSFDEIKISPEYDDIAASLAKANIRVQEQILAIDNNNTENTAAAKANREAAKAAIVKAFADDQAAKITKTFVREREAEIAGRESRTFGMSFDRMFMNMNQSIETTNYNLSKFSDALDASASAMFGQAKLGTTNLDAINTLKNPNMASSAQTSTAIDQASSLFGSEKGLVGSILRLGTTLESSIMTAINKTIQDNPGASDTKVSMEIEKAIGGRLSETKLPAGLTEQLSKQINSAIDQIRKKEGADTKSRRIDFSELIAVIPALKETFDTLKNTQNAAIASLENWKNRLDAYSKSLDRAADIQLEAAQRRNKAEDILVNGSIELSRTFGASPDPASAARLRDSRTARLTGGPTSVTDIVASLQSLEQTRENQKGNLNSLKNSTVGQTGSVQAIMDNERALSKTNYQINQTYAALKNLAESSEAASVAMNAVQSAQQKQAGKVSLLEKLIGSTPEELFNFNNALRRLQLTASGQQLGQTADQRKEVLSVMNDILPLLGNGQEANNLKASTLENLLKDSGVGVNIEFSKIISAIRNPEADPATKLAVEQFKQANEKQAEANRALAGLGDSIATKMIESSASILKSALADTKVKFDDKQLDDILKGLRNVSTVVKPGEPDRKASGGIIYASAGSMVDFSPKGTDTVPAMLTPGEFVVNRSATEKHLPLLRNINSGNYANGGSVRYYADGGYVSSALKPEYKDGINLKKSGKLSTQYEYPELPSITDLEAESMHYYTLTGLSRIARPNEIKKLALPDKNKAEARYNFATELGVGFPETGKIDLIFPRSENRRSSAAPTVVSLFSYGALNYPRIDEVGRFINPSSSIAADLLKTKKLEFDGPEDNARIQKANYADILQQIDTKNLIPQKITTGDSTSITSDKGNYNIVSFLSNKLKQGLPVNVSIDKDPRPLTKSFKIALSNLSSLITDSVGIIPSEASVSGTTRSKDIWGSLGMERSAFSLLDFMYANNNIETKQYSDIGSPYSFTDKLAQSNYAGNINQKGAYESSNLETLSKITNSIKEAKASLSRESQFVEPESDIQLRQKTAFLRNLYQGTSVFEIMDSELFDIGGLGATQDQIKVFSVDMSGGTNAWNNKYRDAIENNIKLSKNTELESLNYWGKTGAGGMAIDIWPEGGRSKMFPWTDKDVPISTDIAEMLKREVDTNVNKIIPNTSTTTKQHNFRFKKGPILSQDVSIPYQLDFTKYLNRYWDPDIDALSDEPMLDGKPIFLVNPSAAPENPFRSLPLGDNRRLFATESALMDNTIGNDIFSQLNSDNTFLEYLSAVINDGYTSEKATKLENPAIEKFQSILSVADKVGILDKISPLKDQRGELFVKNDNMFGGPAIKVNLRDFLQSSTKKLSLDKTAAKENNANKQFSSTLDKYDLDRDGELSQDEKDEAKKDGVDLDRKSYFERSEYPGAALAMILGSQELFGPGGQYELPGVLGRNWFTPTISNAYGSIYDVPNDRIKSYMAELGSYISARFGDVDQSAMYAAQSDPALYDSIKTAKSYMLGANEAFTKLSSGDTSSIVDFFPAGIFKNQTPNGDPAANKAAIEMFGTLGRVSDTSPIANAMIATGLSKDDQKEFSDKLENSMIAKMSSKGDITWTKFSPDDLENSRGEANFKQIFDLALNPYSQFTSRGVRESLLDEFINAIPQARNTDGLPLFTATTGPEYDKSLRLMKKWYGGDGQVSVPLRSWPGVDYLYDQSIMDAAGEPLPFSTKFQELTANLDEQLYADAIMANNYIGGQKAFGDLPNIRFYEGKEPQYRNQGGIVYASAGGSFVNFKPKGPDVIPAMLSDGEFVVNAKQTAQHLPLLKAINDGDAIGSPIGFQDGGMAGVRPFGTPLMAGNSRPNFRARTISQARANRMRDIGFSSRLTDRDIDPSNGDISWSTMFDGDSYKKTKDSIQAAFARIASTDKPESFDNYQSTTKFFQDLRVSFEKEKSKKDTKIEDYRKAQRFISGLEKEYLLASRGGGIRLFENDGIFKDKGLEYDDISDKVSSLRDEADKQFEKDPKERAKRMKGLDTMDKNLRIAKIGTPPRLSEKGMDPTTGTLSFTPGINDNNFESTSRVQNDFTDIAGRGQESRMLYGDYKSKLDNIRDLRAELKTKVDDMDAAAYGRSASYLDSLERELELSARGGGLGVKSKPDMYKPRPYLSTPKQRISVMNKPGEINDQFLDPKTGKITWPLALTDSSLDDTRKKVDTIYSELMTSDNSNMSYEDFAEKRQELQNLTEEFKENVNKYKSGNYGEAKSFLDALTNNFNNVGNKGKDKANTDWRLTGDPKGVSVNGSFLAPDGRISWPSAILRDPAFAKYRTAIENDMKNAADLDGAKFDPKQSSSFKDFMDELKDKQEDFGGFDGEHYQARSFIDGLQRSYNNAGQGKPFGGMTLSDYKTQQAERQEQERQQKQEQERQEGVDFRRRYPVQMLSSSPEAAKSKTDKMADSMTYSSMASMMGEPPVSAPEAGYQNDTLGVIDAAIAQTQLNQQKVKPAPETKLFKPKPTAAGLERERQRSLDLAYESRAGSIQGRILADIEKEGAWDVNAYDAALNRLMRSGTPTKERWKAEQFREAVEKELMDRDPTYARRQWKGVAPSTHYTQSPEYKAQQEKKQQDKRAKGTGPYAPGLPGAIDKAADEFKVGVAQASTLPIRAAAAVSDAMLETGLPEDYGKQKAAVDRVRRKDQARATALTPQENARLAEQERRVAIGADSDMFGANVGDKAYAKFLKLSPEDQKEYLDLRDRAQKGMRPTEYTRLDYLQKTLGVPYQQRERIPVNAESSVSEAKTNASLEDQMRNMRESNIPLLGSRKYVEGLPPAFEEGATLGTVLTRESSAYGDRAKETAIGTGEVVTGTAKVGAGTLAAGLADRVGMTGLVSPETAKAFKDSALETADLGRTQVELGASKYGKNAGIDSASAMIYGESSPQATFYADQQRVQQKQFDAILQKQKAQAEDLAPGLGTSYERAENLSQTAYTTATMIALQDVAIGALTTKPKDYSAELRSAGSGQTSADKLFEANINGKTQWSMKTKPFPRSLSTPPQTITTPKPDYSNSITVSAGEPITPSVASTIKIPQNPNLLTGGRLGQDAFVSYDKLVDQSRTLSGVPDADATNILTDMARQEYLRGLESQVNNLAESMRFAKDAAESSGSPSLLSRIPTSVKAAAGTAAAVEGVRRLTSSTEDKPQKKALGGFIRKYATGGRVAPSFEKSPYAEGTDTVPAMLSEGEFVVNATDTARNLPLLEKLNKGGLAYLAEGSKEPLGYKELKGLAQAQQNYQQSTFGEYLPTWMGGVQKPERTLSKTEQGRLWQEEEKRKVPVFSRLGDAGADMWKRKEVKGDTQAEVAANHAQEMKMHEEALFEEKKKGPSITRFIHDASKAAGSKTEELTGSPLLGTVVSTTTGIAGAMTDPSNVMMMVGTGGLGHLPAMAIEAGSAMAGAGIAKAAGDDMGTKEGIIQSLAAVAVPVGLRAAFEYGPAALQVGRRFAGDVASVGGFAERPSWAPLITETEQALAGSRLQSDMAKKGQQLIHATQNPFAFVEGAEFRPNVRPGATPFIELPGAAGMKAAEIEAAVPDSIFADRARPTSKGLQGHANVLGDSNYFAYTGGDQFQAGFDDSFRYALEKAKTSADLSKATLIPAGLPQSPMDEVLSTPAFGTGHGTPARESLERLAQTRGVSVDSNMTLAELSNANIRAMKAQKISDDGIRASLNINNQPGVSFSNTSIRGETVPGMGVAISKEAPITFGNIAGPIDKNMSSSARTIAELTRAEGIDLHHVPGIAGIEYGSRITTEKTGVSVLIGDHSSGAGDHGDHGGHEDHKLAHKAAGGLIYANNGAFMPKGKDTVPAMLTPGEFVVNSEATQKNLSLLQDINSGSIQYASNGALIGAKSKNIDTRPSENERSVLGAIGTGYYSRGGIVEYLNYGGRAKSQFIGEPPIASGNALYRPENERTQYQTMQYAAPAQDNIVNQSTNMATQSGVLNNSTNMQSSSVGGGFGGMDISGIQRVFENFRQDLTVLQESVTQFSTGAETMASSATQYKEVSTNIASSSDKLANLSLPDQLNVSVTSNLDKLGASVTSEISGTIMRSNQGLVNGLQNYSDSGDKAIANKGFNDSEGALNLG